MIIWRYPGVTGVLVRHGDEMGSEYIRFRKPTLLLNIQSGNSLISLHLRRPGVFIVPCFLVSLIDFSCANFSTSSTPSGWLPLRVLPNFSKLESGLPGYRMPSQKPNDEHSCHSYSPLLLDNHHSTSRLACKPYFPYKTLFLGSRIHFNYSRLELIHNILLLEDGLCLCYQLVLLQVDRPKSVLNIPLLDHEGL